MIEQKQFQGSAESKGFRPVEQTSYIPALEEQHARYRRDADIAAQSIAENGRRTAEQADASWRALAGFSETINKQVSAYQDKKNEEDLQEGLNLYYMDGLPQEQIDAFNEQEASLQATNGAIQSTANSVFRATGNFEGTQQIRNLSGWKRYGYAMGAATEAGNMFGGWAADAMASDNTTQITAGGQTFTPATASTTQQKAAALAVLRGKYMAQKGMVGMNPALLNKYMWPQMREAESRMINSYRTEEQRKQQAIMKDEAYSTFAMNPTPEGFASGIEALEGAGEDRATARKQLLSRITDVNQLEAIGRELSWDGKTPWAVKYASDFRAAKKAILSGLVEDYRSQQAADQVGAAKFFDDVHKQWVSQPPNEEQLKQAEDTMFQTFGYVDPRLKDWAPRTTNAIQAERLEESLDRMDRAGRLLPGMLNDPAIPKELRDKYLSRAEANQKAMEQTPELKAAKAAIEAAIEARPGKSALDAKDPRVAATVELAKAQAIADLNRRVTAALKGGAGPEAIQGIQAGLINEILGGSGVYKFDEAKGFTGMLGKGFGAATWTKHKAAIDELLQANPNAALDRSALIPEHYLQEAIQRGANYTPPPIAVYISDKLGGTVSPWEVMQRQAKARGLGELPLPPALQAAQSVIPPEFLRLLTQAPTYRTVARAYVSSGTFTPELVPGNYGQYVMQSATKYGIPPGILAGVIETESGWNKDAYNKSGATGIAQIMPEFHPGVNPRDPIASIDYAAKYLSQLMKQFDGSLNDAIYSYNAGPNAYRNNGRKPLAGENAAYFNKVMVAAAKYGYNPNGGSPWNNTNLMNPRLAYRIGSIGPTSTGPHLDVKATDGSHFERHDLDPYVEVEEAGKRQPLSTRMSADQAAHRARGSHGIDYDYYAGSKVYLKGGAQVVSSTPTEHGDKMTIRLPNGKTFTFLHGRKA